VTASPVLGTTPPEAAFRLLERLAELGWSVGVQRECLGWRLVATRGQERREVESPSLPAAALELHGVLTT
jgi:hypothetical protein